MNIFSHPDFDDHAAVHVRHDPASGLRAIIALHRKWDGPNVGGCRLRAYADEDEALADVLRLSRGMTYKSVMAGLRYGGSKCVILASPEALADRERLFTAMGDFVDSLHGQVRTGVDVGLTPDDIAVMTRRTPWIAGTGAIAPDVATADGVLVAIQAAARHRLQRDDLRGLRVAVQGLGKVGLRLAGLLKDAGAQVIGAEVDAAAVGRARALGVEIVAPEAIHAVPADVFSPCALGSVLNDATLPELTAAIVAGSANNQLERPEHGEALAARGILYAPDYIANCGGLLAVAADIEDRPEDWVWAKVAGIDPTLEEVFARAATDGVDTASAADRVARDRIDAITAACQAPLAA